MRDGLALYAAAHQLEEETARHLNWIDDEIQRIRQTAAGQELILLIGDEQLVRTAGLPMQIERCGNCSTPPHSWSLWRAAPPCWSWPGPSQICAAWRMP